MSFLGFKNGVLKSPSSIYLAKTKELTRSYRFYLVCGLITASVVACGKHERIPSNELSAIRQWLTATSPSSSSAKVEEQFTGVQNVTSEIAAGQKGNSCYSVQKKRQLNHPDRFVTFDPNAGTLWAGALVQTQTVETGVLDAVIAQRAPVTLSISGRAMRKDDQALGSSKITLGAPSSSSYEDARANLVGPGFLPQGGWTFDSTEYRSLAQSFVALGIKAEWLSSKIASELETNHQEGNHTLLFNFEQHYYTISMDEPSSPEAVFTPETSLTALKYYSDPVTNPIGYVSQVVYGRRIMVMISSSHSVEAVRAAMHAMTGALAGQFTAELSADQMKVLNQSEIKIYSVGSDPNSAVQILGLKSGNEGEKGNVMSLRNIFESSQSDHLVRFGVPISYRVNYLRDNKIMRLGLTADFDVERETGRVQTISDLKVTYHVNDDDKNDNSILTTQIVNNKGEVLAHRIDQGTRWEDNSLQGPFPFELTRGAVSPAELADSQLVICMNGSDDTFRFGVEVNGGTPSGHYFATFGGQAISKNECKRLSLPASAGAKGCPDFRQK